MDFIGNLEAKIVGTQGFEKWKNLENWEIEKNLKELGINVKKYLGSAQKIIFVQDVVFSSLAEKENGIKYIDYIYKKISTDIYVMKEYAGIEFDEDKILDQYDILKENGIVDMIYKLIPENEINELIYLADKTCEQEVSMSNTIENILANGLLKIEQAIPETSQIDKWVKSAMKSIRNFNPEKYKKFNEMLDFAKGETEEKPKKKTTKAKPKTIKAKTVKTEKTTDDTKPEIKLVDNKE